jgi:hypothetical protein
MLCYLRVFNLEYKNIKDGIFNITISDISALIISLINISHHLFFKLGDFIVGSQSPISLLMTPYSGFKVPIAGETIGTRIFWLRKGDLITKYHIGPLKMFFKDPLIEFVIYAFLISIILIFFLSFVDSLSRKNKIILLLLILFVTIFAKFTSTYSLISIYSFPFIGLLGLMTVFFDKNLVKALNVTLSFIISIIYSFNPFLLFSFFISGGFSLFLYKKDEKDMEYVLPFIIGSFFLAIIVSTFDFFFNNSIFVDLINISWTLIALPILYIVIQLLKVYSPVFKKYDVMNYLDLEHPLLKIIREKAPGTYQHTLAMANMAETVANEIGANGLLCRAGAYFHDIGKTKHPEYFIENQNGGENPHNALSPTESARMIKLHVTDGLLMAQEYNLPEYISQFIDKHHGTTILEYFYEKAASEEGANVDVEDFRYPGRKPDSKETAILMIIDAVEAASRTLSEPTQDDIERLVTRIVFSKLLFNQLNLSGVTLSELRKIIVTLINNLKSNSHTRVKYPWQTKNVKKED